MKQVTGLVLLITTMLAYTTPGNASNTTATVDRHPIHTIANFSGNASNDIMALATYQPINPAKPSEEIQAKIGQLRQEIQAILTQELGVDRVEAENVISVAKYLTPSGRDINKIAYVNSKLSELKQLESMQQKENK